MQENLNNSKESWLKLGIKTLDEQGLVALKIKQLCDTLNVTKGCFYHWFASKKEYEIQLLKFWKRRFTTAFIDNAEQGQSAKEKLSLLAHQCIDGAINGKRLEFEINAWSFHDNSVKEFVFTVYKTRYDYLEKLLSDIYPTAKEVQRHALILYSLVIGVDFFYRPLSRDELEQIFSDYL